MLFAKNSIVCRLFRKVLAGLFPSFQTTNWENISHILKTKKTTLQWGEAIIIFVYVNYYLLYNSLRTVCYCFENSNYWREIREKRRYIYNDNTIKHILLERLQMIVLIEFVLLNLYLAINIRIIKMNESCV